jgi:hypothetical protein
MNSPQGAPKKGLSTLAIVLIIGGVLLVLGIGTCGAGAVWLGHKAKEVKENIADGGLVLASPPEVVAELAGPKKEYVGSWTSVSGKSTLDIQADGAMKLVQDERGTKETLTAPIAAFVGNDIEIRFGITFKVNVAEPPHRVGAGFEMNARGITFRRN